MPPSAAPSGFRLADLAQRAGATLAGDGELRVERVATLDSAGPGSIAFLANARYRAQLATTQATAVILAPAEAGATTLPKLLHGNPYACYARVASLLHPRVVQHAGVHPAADVDAAAKVDASAVIGPFVTIGANARIGARAEIGAGCAIGEGVEISADVLLHPHVTIYARCVLGARTIVHSGAVIGADGFGMAEEAGRWLKIPQIGRVVIGADCEIGANTTIDRGAIDDTVIEDDVKLDNQIQIGHNCVIGAHTAIAGCTGIAGSTRIGRNCKVGGAAMIAGHLVIPDNTIISASSGVYDSPPGPGIYTGTFPALPHREWRYVASGVRRLRLLVARVTALERTLGNDRIRAGEKDS
jgi:UDP-3-O-[3-hydroxymyristoyl] glucosamine N-acyltransferase